jgi:hypothetical protein
MHLLLKSNIEDGKKAYGFTLKSGQMITTLPKLSAETGLSEREVRTALDKLTKGRQISQKTTNKFRVITVENWAFYQGMGQQSDRQTTDKPQESGQTNDSLKQRNKEIKKKNNTISAEPKKEKKATIPKNRFVNYPQSEYDFEEIERQERLQREKWVSDDEPMEGQTTLHVV